MLLDTVHSYNAGVILHTQTPTRSNLALIVGAGGDEFPMDTWHAEHKQPKQTLKPLCFSSNSSIKNVYVALPK